MTRRPGQGLVTLRVRKEKTLDKQTDIVEILANLATNPSSGVAVVQGSSVYFDPDQLAQAEGEA